jgi:hypothetical protein
LHRHNIYHYKFKPACIFLPIIAGANHFRVADYSAIELATATGATLRSLKLWDMLRNISGRFTLLAQYALDNFRRRAPTRDGTGAQDWKMRARATHGVDGRSEYNSTDSAGANGIGAHETGFGARVKRAFRQVKCLQNLARPTNGFHFGVMGNIKLRSDAFDSLGDHGAVAHNDRSHWNFTAFASNSGQFQTQTHIRLMQRASHLSIVQSRIE